MKGQQDEDDENENLIETEQKGLDHILSKIKVVIFKVLFVLAKEEKTDDQMIYFYILASLDYVQMHSFPFNNKIIYIWKADSFLTNILNFVNVFSLSTYVPNLSYFTLLVSVYVCLGAILLIILNIFYVSYSFSQNKFKFMWPVYLLRSVAYYFVTVLFLPITETLTSILSCYNEPTTNDYVIYGYNEIHIQCWQGWHLFHALITLLFMAIFVIICVLVAYAFFEPGMTNGNRTARQDSNGEVSFILNKVFCQILFCFLGENQSWVLVIATFLLSLWLFKEYNIEDPIYDFEVGRFYSIISCYYLWANIMLFICKLEESTGFSGGLIAWVIGLPFIVSIMLSAKKSKVDTLVRAQNKFSSGEDVWAHIRYVLQLISQADTNKNSYMLLIGYIEKHKETCKLTDCYFKQNRKSVSLELDDLKRGLIIELDKMFRIGLRKFGSSASLRIFYALFLMERRNNKNDAFFQFSLVSQKAKPKLFQQFITYRYMKIIKDKSDDVVDAIENKNNKSELYKKMKMSALYYKAFWAELKEDQPNLVRLMSIGAMITKVSNQVIEKHNEMLKKSSLEFADLKALTNFYYQIFNDSYNGSILKKMYRQAKLQISMKVDDDENIIERTPQPFLQVSSRKSEIGKIINLNSLFTTYFGYQKEELRGKSINVLMPKVYADQHDHYLLEFFDSMLINMQFEGDYPRTYLDQEQIQFFKHRNGYIVPFIYKVTFNIDLLHYMAVFKSDPTFKGQPVFIVNASTQICEMSSGAIQHFDIELRHLKLGVNLNDIFPDILNQNGKHVTYQKGDLSAYFQCSAKEIEIAQIMDENLLLEQEASKKIIKSGYWVVKLEKLEFNDLLGARKASHFINSARNLLPIQSRQSIQVTQRQSISITQKLIHTRTNQTAQSIDTAGLRIDTNFEYDQNLMQFLQELYTEQRYDDYKDMLSQQNDTQTMEKTDYGCDIRTRRLINNQLLNIDEEKESDFLRLLEEEEQENSIFRSHHNLGSDEGDSSIANNQYSQIVIRSAMSSNHKHGKISKFCIYAKIWIDFIALLTALQYYFCSLNFEGFTSEIKAIYQINNEILALNTLISRVLDLSMPEQYNISGIHSDIYSAAQEIISFDLSLNQEFYHSYFDDQMVLSRIYETTTYYEEMQLSLENAILLITSECLNATNSETILKLHSNSLQIILYNFFNQIRDPLIKISQNLYNDILSQVEYPDLNLLISLLVLFLGTSIGMIRFITLMLEIKADKENVIFLFLEIPQKDVSGLAKKVDKFLKFYNEDLKKLNDCQYDDSSDEEEEQIFLEQQIQVDGLDRYDSKAIEEDNQLQLQLKRKKIIQKYRKNKLKGSKGIIVQFLSIALLTLVFAVYNIISSSNEKSQITYLLPQFYSSSIQIENYGYFINLYKLHILDSEFLINQTIVSQKIKEDLKTFTGNQYALQNFAQDLLTKLPELRALYFQTYYGNLCTLVDISNCQSLIQGNLELGIYNVEQYYLYYFLTHDQSDYSLELYEIDLSLFKCIKLAVNQILNYELNFMTTEMANTLTIQLILVIIYILILEFVVSVIWLLFLQKLNTQINLNLQMLNMIPMKVVENNRKIRMFIRQCVKKLEIENT